MFGSNFAEVGIGLAFLFLLLSLACSMSSEVVSRMLSWRAVMLEEGIRELLHDSAAASELLSHPLLKGLRRDLPLTRSFIMRMLSKIPLIGALPVRWSKPSNIPSGMFARALFDVLLTAPRRKTLSALCNALTETADQSLLAMAAQIKAAEYDSAGDYRAKLTALRGKIAELVRDQKKLGALLERVDEALAASTEDEETEDLKAKISTSLASLESSEVRRALRVLLAQGDVHDAVKARAAIARWFDDGMEHVSDWYKRKSQRLVFAIAAMITVSLNIDTLLIGDRLMHDTTLRALVVASGEAALERYRNVEKSPAPFRKKNADPEAEPEPLAPQSEPGLSENVQRFRELKLEIEGLKLPIGWPTQEELKLAIAKKTSADQALSAADAHLSAARQGIEAAQKLADEKQKALRELGRDAPPELRENAQREAEEATLAAQRARDELKAAREGLEHAREQAMLAARDAANERAFPKDGNAILMRLLGWLFTALGASLGAQFWFDVLSRLLRMKSAQKAPEASNASSG